MAETAGSIVTDAFDDINQAAGEQAPEAVDMSKGIRYLNRMMAALDVKGISLGYTVVTGPDSPITAPDGATEGMVAMLALRLSPSYNMPGIQELRDAAKAGFDAMLDIAVVVLPKAVPCTLPIGSGNEGNFHHDHFFPCPDESVLTEDNGNILLESET